MKLYYSTTSPYARKIRLLAASLDLEHAIELEAISVLDPPPEFLVANPLGKIPVLVQDGETPLFDSRVITEFLLDRAGQNDTGRSKTEMLKRQALADGMTDAALSIFMERSRPDAQQSDMWVKRWFAALDRGFAHFEESGTQALKDWSVDSIAAAAAFDYICFRLPDYVWADRFPKTYAWFTETTQKPSMKATDPRL